MPAARVFYISFVLVVLYHSVIHGLGLFVKYIRVYVVSMYIHKVCRIRTKSTVEVNVLAAPPIWRPELKKKVGTTNFPMKFYQ